MLEEHSFARSDPFPSWFANAIQKYLSVGAQSFRVIPTDTTHVKVPAGADDQAAAIAIAGLWRWMEVDVGPVAHPGGAAGTYPVFVTAKNENIVSTPLPYTDSTDRTFGLQVLAPGATPTIVAGTVDQYRHVADLVWDGTKITHVNQLVPRPPMHATQHATGGLDPIAPADIGAAASGQAPPIGAEMPYTGQGDPPGGVWMIADGRLIDSTTYAAFDATCGRTAPVAMRHAYNAGVDPGSNKVKIPDKRGKKSIGAINMGSALGAGANDNSHHQAVQGTSYGEVNHTTTLTETASHQHSLSGPALESFAGGSWAFVGAGTAAIASGGTLAAGSGAAHNNIDPAEADSYIVRVA